MEDVFFALQSKVPCLSPLGYGHSGRRTATQHRPDQCRCKPAEAPLIHMLPGSAVMPCMGKRTAGNGWVTRPGDENTTAAPGPPLVPTLCLPLVGIAAGKGPRIQVYVARSGG